MNLILLSLHFRLLNLSENMGMSLTMRSEKTTIKPNKIQGVFNSEMRGSCNNPHQKRALAGTASPKNDVVWRVSVLNFASLKAEKITIINPKNGIMTFSVLQQLKE